MSKPNKQCQDKDWLYDQYITKGKTTYQIAKEIGCSASAVQRWLRHHEIQIRDCSASHLDLSAQLLSNEEWLRDQYLVQKKSATVIGTELGCQQETVSKYIHKYGIPLRSQSEEISGERHPLYGTHHSAETKQKISISNSGENNANFGKSRPEHSALMSGSGNPHYGTHIEKDQKERQKASLSKFYENNPEQLEHQREVMRTHRITRRGPDSNFWKGGISFEPYCPKFNHDLKERVRSFFDYTCVMCGKTTEENGISLAVHHVEYDKSACCHGKPIHFVALCHRCHSRTNFNREHWESLLHRIIDEIYEGRSYYTKEEYYIKYLKGDKG